MKKFFIFLSLVLILGLSYVFLSDWLVPPATPVATGIPADNEVLPEDAFVTIRKEMVLTQIEARGVRDDNVLQAMRTVPRHEFVLEQYIRRAYIDQPLPWPILHPR